MILSALELCLTSVFEIPWCQKRIKVEVREKFKCESRKTNPIHYTVCMDWVLNGKSAHLMCQLCLLARTHAHTLVRCHGSSGFQCVLWKVLTLANISWCGLFFLFAYWLLPQPAPIVRAFYLNVNTIITAGDATAGVYLCLSVLSPLSFCVFVLLSEPLLLSFHQFCLTAIIMCLPNGIHLESTFSTLCKHLYFYRLDIPPLFPHSLWL